MYNIICQYHPAAALHQPYLWATMLDDWCHLPSKVNASYTIVSCPIPLPKLFSLDTENDAAGKLGAWSIAYRDESGRLCVCPFEYFIPFFIVPDDSRVIMHNVKWDTRCLARNKMQVPKNVVDTMIAAYCLPPSTKILYRDLSWKPIGQSQVGDELIGVDEDSTPEHRRKMRLSIITAKSTRRALCYKITLNDRRILTSTGDHKWLIQRLGSNSSVWRRTDELQIGWKMPASLVPWEEDTTKDGGYLAGILDGEGWVNSNYLSAGIAQNPGVVLEKTKRLLKERGFNYTESKASNSNCHKLNLSSNRTLMKLIGSLRPTRLLQKEFWNGKETKSQNQPVLTIVGIEIVEEQEVISIETSTHTFNAEGCWTHNCLGHGKQDPKDTGKSGDRMVGGLGLKYLGRRHLGMQMKSWNEVKDHPDQMLEYNAADSVATYLLWEKWEKELPQHFWTIDMPLLPVLMKMEDRGILVDSNFLQEYAKTLDERLKEIDLKGINPYSPDQVAEYVYDKLGYQVTKRTEGGKPSTDKEVLETIDDPIVKGILEYREIYKERGTYVSAYAERMDNEGRIHCEFKQVSTVTGRLSSANPNLQNVTKGKLRTLFVPSPGKSLVVLDWQQIELRVFATLTQEEKMLDALHSGRSIHQETADVLNIPYDEAKNVNFLMLYGGGAWKLSQEFGVNIDDAHAMIASYYKAYPGIKIYHERQREIARTERQVTTWSGRTRRLDGMFSEYRKTIRDAENLAINLPVQGTAGEIVKLAMIDLDKKDAPMLLQVHDEIIFEVEEKQALEYARWLRDYVPTLTEINGERFYVDVGIGKNWYEAKEKENLLK